MNPLTTIRLTWLAGLLTLGGFLLLLIGSRGGPIGATLGGSLMCSTFFLIPAILLPFHRNLILVWINALFQLLQPRYGPHYTGPPPPTHTRNRLEPTNTRHPGPPHRPNHHQHRHRPHRPASYPICLCQIQPITNIVIF
jgi:hypothetical protein